MDPSFKFVAIPNRNLLAFYKLQPNYVQMNFFFAHQLPLLLHQTFPSELINLILVTLIDLSQVVQPDFIWSPNNRFPVKKAFIDGKVISRLWNFKDNQTHFSVLQFESEAPESFLELFLVALESAERSEEYFFVPKSVFIQESKLHILADTIPRSDLAYRISNFKYFSEEETQFYICQLLLIMEEEHKKNRFCGPLSLDNIYVHESGNIRLPGFPGARDPIYACPERETKITIASEIWEFGILVFEMLAGLPPFFDANMDQPDFTKELSFPPRMSDQAKHLVTACLTFNPQERVTKTRNLKEFEFFKGIDWEKVSKRLYEPPWIPTKEQYEHCFIDPAFLEEPVGDDNQFDNFAPAWAIFTYKPGQ